MVKLRENEQKTLLTLQKLNGRAKVPQIIETGGLAHAAVMRAALTLEEKKLVTVHEETQQVVELNEEGKQHAQRGLPERRLINALIELNGEALVGKVVEKAQLDKKFVTIALGWLHRKGWATLKEKNSLRTEKKTVPQGADEKLLSLLKERGSLTAEMLDKEMQNAVSILKGRKLLEVTEKAMRELELTEAGWQTVRKGLKIATEVNQLTPELIVSGKWRETKLRRFDVTAPGPEFYPAKVHPLQQVIQRAREIFLEMGFTEIRGPLVETKPAGRRCGAGDPDTG